MVIGLSKVWERNLGLRQLARSLVLKTAASLRIHDLALAARGSGSCTVVEMHETLSAHADQFQRQVEWVAKRFALITPELFARALETRTPTWPGSKPAVLFTFDDGRESNYLIAAPILESLGARGIFFVVPQFIGLEGNAAKEFYYSKIDIRNIMPVEARQGEIWKPMMPLQLADLARRGHWIGNHTLSHANLVKLPAPELEREIRASSEQISLWTGKSVDAFAWAYSWDAIDRGSLKAIKQAHRLCFSPCPGTVRLAADSPDLIWRTEIESHYAPAEYQFMYAGLVDPIWARKRRKLKQMLRGTS
jgi:peptidoglycan/xylan/chitin deacetylase (PgdA/CDA1 family)